MATDILERIKQGNLLFSILSLVTCTAIIILIFFQKQLRSITYTFLMFIFGSEIIHSVGNIILDTIDIKDKNYKEKNIAALCILSFTDMFTNILFVFFTYCSIKLIKNKVPRFIFFSSLFSLIYMIAYLIVCLKSDDTVKIMIDIRFRGFYQKSNSDNLTKKYYVLSSIHTFLIIVASIISLRNTYVVLSFMSEKQKMDKANAKSIARLIKILRRYPIVCILYWLFLIPRIIFVSTSEKQHILRDTLYFISESFFRLRGFLIFLNTFRSSKIQIIIYRIIEVDIKHNCLLNLKICRKKRRNSRAKSKNSIDRPLVIDN